MRKCYLPFPSLHLLIFFIFSFSSFTVGAQTESEPNDAFASANTMSFATNMAGGVACAGGDVDDYFRVVLPAGNKSIRLITSANTLAGTANMYVYLYNKFQGQLADHYLTVSTTSLIDTLDVDCFEGDTFYVRVRHWTGGCKQYSIRCESTNAFTLKNDVEINDDFTLAQGLIFQKDTTGHLNSQRYGAAAYADVDDYYRCVPPPGTKSIRLTTSTRMVSPGASGNVYYYLYNKFKQELTNMYVSPTSAARLDTLDFDCFEGDTFYVRVRQWTGGCKEYRIKADITNHFTLQNDAEVNDDFSTAQGLFFQKDTAGHLNAQRYGASAYADIDDYYRCIPPAGTKSIRLTTSTRMVTPGASGNVYYYLYNKFKQELTNMYVSPTSTARLDTLDFDCFEGDTIYVRVRQWTGGCKEYRIKADITNRFTLQNDAEVNDNFATSQGLIFQKDTTGHLNSQRYGAAAYADVDDYYQCVPPAGTKSIRLTTSTRMVTPGANGNVYYYLYNKFRQELANMYVSPTSTARLDTLDFDCFEGDTFYVRVRQWTGGCKEYRIKTDVTNSFTLKNDAEVNDDFATAQGLIFQKDTTGNLNAQRYGTGSYADVDDYYRCVLPPGGTRSIRLIASTRSVTPGSSGNVYYYLYNKYQQELTNRYVSINNTLRTDTVDYTCFEGDTFYVRVRQWTGGCKEYRIRTDYTGLFTLQNDTEPNETLATAQPVDYKQEVTGHMASEIYGPTARRIDNDDYFRFILPDNGKGIRVVSGTRMVEPGANGSVYYYLYNKSGTQLASKYLALTNTPITDTFDFNCARPDTFYIRVRQWTGGCKEYSFSIQKSPEGPVYSAFERTRFGSSFSFVNRSRNTNSQLWLFGDGHVDTTSYPVHTYVPGVFPVVLRATGVCGNAESRDTLKVEGIEYYTPKSAATTGGYGLFNLRFFGAGLDTLAVVTLKRGSSVLQPTRTKSPSTKELNLLFNMRGADTGVYDVEIVLRGGQKFSYPAGFRIFSDTPGFGITTQLNGPDRVRTGTWTNYSVLVKNNKHSMANGVCVFIAVPQGVETNIQEVLRKKTGVFRVEGSGYDALTIDRNYYNQVYYGGEFNPNTDIIEMDYDALNAVFDSTIRVPIDSLFGQPFKGTLYPIYVPAVAGAGTWQMSFKMRSTSNGNYRPVAYAWPFVAHVNPSTGDILTTVHDIGLAGGSALELAPHPAAKVVGKSVGYVDIGSQVAFTEFFDWYYGVNVADEDYYKRQGTALAGELASELIPVGDNAQNALRKVDQSKDNLRRLNHHANRTEDLLRNDLRYLTDHKRWEAAQENLRELMRRSKEWEGNLDAFQKEAVKLGLGHIATEYGMNKLTQAIGNNLFPDELIPKPIQSVTSMDPNAIYGPSGPTGKQYIRQARALDYLVTFENVDTALAPAAIVRIETQLDTNKFDLARTTLGNITVGGRTYLVEPDRQEYFRDIDLRPAKNLIVRVNAHFDSTGRGYWEFTSLDPATMDVPEDPTVGFLPPNVTSPEGEGSVSFVTYLKPGVGNRDSLSAEANIFFDANDPIRTGRWQNTVDEGVPATAISPVITVTDDTVMHLTITGADAESGVERYAVYVNADSAWSSQALYFNPDGSTPTIIGAPGGTYSFYVVSKDSVGIWESKPKAAEATITLKRTTIPGGDNSITLYPNPARTQVTVGISAPDAGPIQIVVTDINGRRALELSATHPSGQALYQVPLSALGSGVYFVEAMINDKKLDPKKLVIIR